MNILELILGGGKTPVGDDLSCMAHNQICFSKEKNLYLNSDYFLFFSLYTIY